MLITPTFHFDGQCEEAIKLYQKAFGAKIGCLLRYSDADPRDFPIALTDAQKRRVYHAEIAIGDARIMMCDNMDVPFAKSLSLFLTVTMDTKEQVLAAYEVLKDGGEIIYPPHSTTYSSQATVLVDKFGFRWGVMTEQTEK